MRNKQFSFIEFSRSADNPLALQPIAKAIRTQLARHKNPTAAAAAKAYMIAIASPV